MITFLELSGSLTGSSGSRLPDVFAYNIAQKSWVEFDEIFRKCPKWDKEHVIRFWE